MRRLGLPLVVVVVFGSALGAGTAGGEASAGQRDPCRPQPAAAMPAPLTSAQCVEASRIVADDSYLRKLLAGVRYTVDRPEPWGSNDGVRNLGAVLSVHLAKRLYVTRTNIPTADFPESGGDNYIAGHEAVSINGATGLTVFVDLGRRRVVWVIPMPSDSEGPPPTSFPPYTLPAGFEEGVGGATAADAASGLVLHLAVFDSSGRLFQEEWFDSVTGKGVTNVYDPERKLAASMASVLTGSTMRVTTVTYRLRTWTAGSGTLPVGGIQALALDSRTLPARLQNGATLGIADVGPGSVDGLDAERLHGTVGIPYWGVLFVGGLGDIWVDPATFIPIEMTLADARSPTDMKIVFSWLPRASGATSHTVLAVPAGYKHVPSSGLPHIFGD